MTNKDGLDQRQGALNSPDDNMITNIQGRNLGSRRWPLLTNAFLRVRMCACRRAQSGAWGTDTAEPNTTDGEVLFKTTMWVPAVSIAYTTTTQYPVHLEAWGGGWILQHEPCLQAGPVREEGDPGTTRRSRNARGGTRNMWTTPVPFDRSP